MYTDPGDKKKRIIVADVRTKIRGCKDPVRTILLMNEKEKELLMSVESFVVWRFVHGNERNAVNVFNKVFDTGWDKDASEEEIRGVLDVYRKKVNI